jgi:hypothetical protein
MPSRSHPFPTHARSRQTHLCNRERHDHESQSFSEPNVVELTDLRLYQSGGARAVRFRTNAFEF